MAITEGIFRFHSIRFTGAQFGATPVVLGGTSTSSASANANVEQTFADGSPFATRSTITNFAEELSFTTTNIDKALDLIGTTSACLRDGSTVEVFYARYDGCNAGPTPGAVHRKITLTQAGSDGGVLHGGTLSTDHRGDAQFDFMIKPQSDGTNSPIVIGSNVTLPTGLIDNQNRYTIGPAEIAGVLIDGIKSINTDFGITIQRESADSSVFDEFFTLSQVASKTTISGINPSWWDAAKLGVIGKAGTHANTSWILRKRLIGNAGFVDRAALEHIKISTAGVIVPSSYYDSSDSAPVSSSLEIYSEFDGTNVPIFATTGVAY